MVNIRVALAQLNPTVGALQSNLDAIIGAYTQAVELQCGIVAYGELSVTGYPPEDLLLKPRFIRDQRVALDEFAAMTTSTVAVVGFIDSDEATLYNAAAICANGSVRHIYRKRRLPNYGVFDEVRYFEPGHEPLAPLLIGGVPVGVTICEDMWSTSGPQVELVERGARLIININGSPYHLDKDIEREHMISERARALNVPIVYVNQVGGQDELVFDGGSFAVDTTGMVVARCPQFTTDLLVCDMSCNDASPAPDGCIDLQLEPLPLTDAVTPLLAAPLDGDAELYEALVLGTRDYCTKNGFSDVVIGLSGGIDSTLVACVAVDALGPGHVHGVAMPSRYSSDHSLSDAHSLAGNLGIDIQTISIEPAFSAYMDMLTNAFEGREPGLTWENVQSRCRGQILMALSNELGWMVLTTGNKSEMAVGYFTIYGDSVGGYAVIKDIFKTDVYALSHRVNERAGRELIPRSTLDKAPSAELRPDQRDDQSLPPYEVLDPILAMYVEQDRTATEIIEAGYPSEIVNRITRLVDIAEYKRRQSPPGVRVTQKAFGKDRRMPITNGYR